MVSFLNSVRIFLIRNRDWFFLGFCRNLSVIAINYKSLEAMADKTCKRSEVLITIFDMSLYSGLDDSMATVFLKELFSETKFIFSTPNFTTPINFNSCN